MSWGTRRNGASARTRCWLGAGALAAAALVAGCGGGGSGAIPSGATPAPPDPVPPGPAAPNPVGLAFRSVDIGAPAAPDGVDYRTREFRVHHGLAAIAADAAYRRGYFGQGVTVAIADAGMDPTHPDLAGRIRAPRHVVSGTDRVFEPDLGPGGGTGHGTYVAMLAAGARGNAEGDFRIAVAGGDPIPTPNVHGVAPRASIVPISLNGGGQPPAAVWHAVANGAQVVNFSIGTQTSYFGEYAGRDGYWLTTALPLFGPLVDDGLNLDFAAVAAAVGNADVVMVWAAGNDGWNSRNNRLRMCGKNHLDEGGCKLGEGPVSAREFMRNFTWLPDPDDFGRKVPFKDMWGACGEDDCADYNSGGGWKEAPLSQPGLLGKWLVVAAMDRNGEIAGFSNGCGAARNWCLMAPGQDIAVGPGGSVISGTSFAAPMASGALAVLKSRLPGMPMDVVQALLLVSADPLGTRIGNPREPDPVYGWGRLNLGNAVTMQGTVHLPYSVPGSAATREAPLRGARLSLSPALARMGGRLRSVEVAVGGVGNAYYNTNLFDAVDIEVAGPRPAGLGHAARDMIAPARGHRAETGVGTHSLFTEVDPDTGEVRNVGAAFSGGALGGWRLRHNPCGACGESAWREWSSEEPPRIPFFADPRGAVAAHMRGKGVRPFAAAGGGNGPVRAPWHQLGLRWRSQGGAYATLAEVSRIGENRSVWGTDFGALGDTRTRTLQGRFQVAAELGGNWRGFVGYEHATAEVSATGGMLSGISGLRAEGWSLGGQGTNVVRDGDAIRFSARQETAVRGGQARIDHAVATGGSFVEAFYGGRPQTLERRRTSVELSARPTTRYSLGYALPIGRDAQLAVALEYEGESGDRAVSTQFRMEF